MGPGRPPDHAPEGFYTVTEASKLLGITPAAVRGRIERGTLPTKESHHLTEGLETRHYIPKEPVDKEVAEKNLPANRAQVDERTSAVVGKLDDMTLAARAERAAILAAVENQDEHISTRLDSLLINQEGLREGLEAAIGLMREAADRQEHQREEDKKYREREKMLQERALEIFENIQEMIDRDSERQAEGERRSIWRRLFGG